MHSEVNGYLEELLLAKCAELENGVKEFCTVDNYCKRVYSGGTPSTKNASYWNGALPWLSSGETRARFIIGAEKTITPEGVRCSSTKLARRGNVVMASAGQGFTRGQTSMLLFDAYVNQSIAVMEPKEGCGSYLLFALARRYEELRAWSDSTSTRGSMSGKVLKQFALPRLSSAQLGQFETFANPLVQRIEINLRESKSLAALRDALLPKLMSGEIDVSKVDLTQLNSHLAETLRPFGCHIPAIQKTGQLALLRTAPYPRPSRYSANQHHSPTSQRSRQTIPCVWASPLGRNPPPPLPPAAVARRLRGARSGIGTAI